METLLTLNNARVVRELLIFLFSLKLHSRSKSTLGCYIVKATASVASSSYKEIRKKISARIGKFSQNGSHIYTKETGKSTVFINSTDVPYFLLKGRRSGSLFKGDFSISDFSISMWGNVLCRF